MIKKSTGDNTALNIMAHAVMGAVVAQAQGNSAGAGAAGAATGELIARRLYPGTATADLTQEQKETVSALSGLAAGLAGGIAGGDLSGAVTGAQAGTNAVQNNLLSNTYGVERLDKTSLALYEKLKAAGIGSIDELQKRFTGCAGDGECERGIRNAYRQQEKQAGETLVGLYKAGKLSQEELAVLVTDYSIAMMAGAKEGQLSSDSGGYGDIYSLSGIDWTPMGVIGNPYLDAIKKSGQIAQWRREGLSEEKINELAHKSGLVDSMLVPVDVPGILNIVDNGASKEDVLRSVLVAGFGKLAKDSAKAKGQIAPEVISPTYRELQGLNNGFQAHHILPQYLGKMLGYTKNDMLDYPATLITQYSHTGKVNPDAMHKAISKYLPPMVGGKPATYTSGQISSGLQKAYGDIGRPELFDSIKHLIK
ncbi:VENN motif pre-toxin domain-containing protein [Pseudomonas graminis]|nr:VENN motif pre-toxin domain-containing protein [Pseudomonas graminis]